jgi:hypothetical protein
MSKNHSGGISSRGSCGGYVGGPVFCSRGATLPQRVCAFSATRRRTGGVIAAANGWTPERTLFGRRFRYGKGGRR